MNKYIIKFDYTLETGRPVQYNKEIEATEDKLAIMEGIKEVTAELVLGKILADDTVEILTNLMMEIDDSLTVNGDRWMLSGDKNYSTEYGENCTGEWTFNAEPITDFDTCIKDKCEEFDIDSANCCGCYVNVSDCERDSINRH